MFKLYPKTIAFIILLLYIIASGIEHAGAAELRVPVYSVSQHYNLHNGKVEGGPNNSRHPTAGLEVHWSNKVSGAYRYVDSYNVLSFALYAGQEFTYKGLFTGYHLGATDKGYFKRGAKGLNEGWLPLATTFIGLKYETVHVILGYVPVPKKLGASVGYIRFSFRIKDLGL